MPPYIGFLKYIPRTASVVVTNLATGASKDSQFIGVVDWKVQEQRFAFMSTIQRPELA